MRAGKNLNAVEPKRTRSCVVRLEKVRAPFIKGKPIKIVSQNIAANRTSSGSSKLPPVASQEIKKISAPLNKRPVTQSLSSASQLARVTALLRAAATPKSVATATPKSVATATPKSVATPTLKSVATATPKSAPILSKSDTSHRQDLSQRTSTTPRSATGHKTPATARSTVVVKATAISRTAPTSKSTSSQKSIGTPKIIFGSNKARSTPLIKAIDTSTSKTSSTAAAPAEDEVISTIAAGRSRRAIKPNPKYASDDMITPKMIKHVGTHSSSLTPKDSKKTSVLAGSSSNISIISDRKRKRSTSSSEDFFNKDSSETEYETKQDDKDKPYKVLDDSDSDFSDLDLPQRFFKPRARETKQTDMVATTKSARPNTIPSTATEDKVLALKTKNISTALKSGNPVKPVAMFKAGTGLKMGSEKTQLSQLRRSLLSANSNASRSMTTLGIQSSVASKRKINDSSNESESDSFAIKRKRFSDSSKAASLATSLSPHSNSNLKTPLPRKSLSNNQTINGSKVFFGSNASKISNAELLLEKRKALLEKSLASKTPPIKTTSVTKQTTQNLTTKLLPTSINKPVSKQTALRQRISSTESPKIVTPKVKENEDVLKTSPTSNTEDFETMPTFTIVNINDIISKKGNALISKGNALSKSVSSKAQSKTMDEDDVNEISEDDEDDVIIKDDHLKKPDNKLSRRKYDSNISPPLEKLQAENNKTPPHRMATGPSKPNISSSSANILSKKPTKTVLNHNLVKENENKTNQRETRNTLLKSSSNKPAPRILNSVVAKKTLPVKPLIANMDDSADESYPFSIEDELDDIDDGEEDFDDSSNVVGKHRTFIDSKKSAPGTKENSLAATNRVSSHTSAAKTSPTSLPSLSQRKLSPEKVVISRQGDKIIKKITCFETWYIINLPEDRPSEIKRNQLDIPLIKLANSSNSIVLPTSSWNSKVTLYQLNPSTLMKTNYTTYTGDISEQNIAEEDRGKYQPSCVMFRRSVNDRSKSRLPYDRAVIFKNKTFFTNIDGKNVKLVGAPFKISSLTEVEILLQLVDELNLQSSFVEQTTTVQ